jgi:hypothetical protein
MLSAAKLPGPPKGPPPPRREPTRFTRYPWGHLAMAAVPVGLGAWYMAGVAPALVPLPAGMKVPYPLLTGALEEAAAWSGGHPAWVAGIGVGLLAAGTLFRVSAARYYAALAIVVSAALGIAWYSISAPVDRLIHSVEEEIPRDSRVPGGPGR